MNTHKKRTIIFFVAILFGVPGISWAQYSSTDTVEKLIYGIGNSIYIKFDDPDGLPNHIEMKVLNNATGLQIAPAQVDNVPFKDFIVTSKQYGTYIIECKYRRDTIRSVADSGTEYIRVIVRKPPVISSMLDKGAHQVNGPDILKEVGIKRGCWDCGHHKDYFIFTEKTIFLESDFVFGAATFWVAPPGRTIVDVSPGFHESDKFFILLDDGSTYITVYVHGLGWGSPIPVNSLVGSLLALPGHPQYEVPQQIIGDDLYLRTNLAVYVTRDFGKSWQYDTLGLNGATPNMLQLDSNQNVYLTTSNGLFTQGPKENSWKLISSLPTTYVTSLFIDRRDRLFVGSFSPAAFMSTDRGATWTADTAGLGKDYILSFGEDAFGNIYATTTSGIPNKLIRSLGGTGTWSEIALSIRALSIDSGYTNLFHSIVGDSTLLVGTLFGLYQSIDQGNTWTEANQGLRAINFYDLIKNTDGSAFLSTNRGIYQGFLYDSVWTKRYPVNGYMNGAQIFKDDNGILYTLGPQRVINYTAVQPITYKSIDNGLSWVPDTDGISSIPAQGSFFVSANGEQHLIVQLYGKPIEIFSKFGGSPWKRDENGFTSPDTAYVQSLGSDREANFYVVLSNSAGFAEAIWRRTMSGNWSLDTNGLGKDVIYGITGGRNDDVYALGYYTGVRHLVANNWSLLQPPVGVSGTLNAPAVSVDSSGTVFAAYSHGTDLNHLTPDGVYFSTDNGTHWVLAGLEGITIGRLISYGDTTYALTNEGIFALTRAAGSAVPVNRNISDGFWFSLFPNPSGGKLNIDYLLDKRSSIAIEIYSVLGEKLLTLASETDDAGNYHKQYDLHSLASGQYLLSFTQGRQPRVVRSFEVLK